LSLPSRNIFPSLAGKRFDLFVHQGDAAVNFPQKPVDAQSCRPPVGAAREKASGGFQRFNPFFQKTDAILGFPLLPQKPVSLGGQAESFAPQPAVVVEDSVYFLPQRFDKLCTVVHISFERN
jgi:hypothetical protein